MKFANLQFGRWGERKAIQYLRQKGYQILYHHWTCRWGEIDVIAQKQGRVIFCEVKARRQDVLESFDPCQQKRLWRSIQFYLAKNRFQQSFQVDFIGVESGKIIHLQNVLEDLN